MSTLHEFVCLCNARLEAKFGFQLVVCWNCKRVWRYRPRLARVTLAQDVQPGTFTPIADSDAGD